MSTAAEREKEIASLKGRVATLERQIKEVARTATTTAIFVNAIVKLKGIKNADLQEALVEAGMGYAAAQLFQSKGTGTTGGGSGNGDGVISPTEGNRRDSTLPAGQGQGDAGDDRTPPSNGDLTTGNGSTPSGGGVESGSGTEASEDSKDPTGG